MTSVEKKDHQAVRLGRRALLFGAAAALAIWYVFHLADVIIPPARADCDDYAAERLPEVVLYGASWCPYCQKTRWFLEDRDVAYCEYDIDVSAVGAAAFQDLNATALPVVLIGARRVDGFDETRLEIALRAQNLL